MSACYEAPQEDQPQTEAPDLTGAGNPFRCVMTVDMDGILRNLEALRRWTQAQLIAVVKNNGYGLGLVPYARLLAAHGVRCFAVARIEEAVALRQSGFEPDIVVMTPPQDAVQARQLAQWRLTAAADSLEQLTWLEQAAFRIRGRCPVHLKFDTGFGRFGFAPEAAQELAGALERFPHVDIDGIFSHCGILEPRPARRQFELFLRAADTLEQGGCRPRYRHFCNSSMAMLYPFMQLDAIRVGSALLGRLPCPSPVPLERIGQLRARVLSVHDMPAGSRPGYGGVQRLARATPVAVVNAGWQEGLSLERHHEIFRYRQLFSQIKGLLTQMGRRRCATWRDRRLPVIGRGGMTFTLLDASDCDLAAGDWVTMEVNPLMVPGEVRREYIGGYPL